MAGVKTTSGRGAANLFAGSERMANSMIAFGWLMSWECLDTNPGKITSDEGGRTRYGIAERWHPELWKDREPTLQDAYDVFRAGAWSKSGGAYLMSQRLGSKLSSHMYNAGDHPMAKLFQQALNEALRGLSSRVPGLKIDGNIGRVTIGAANALPEDALLGAFVHRLRSFYRDLAEEPEYAQSLGGWMVRAEAVPS